MLPPVYRVFHLTIPACVVGVVHASRRMPRELNGTHPSIPFHTDPRRYTAARHSGEQMVPVLRLQRMFEFAMRCLDALNLHEHNDMRCIVYGASLENCATGWAGHMSCVVAPTLP